MSFNGVYIQLVNKWKEESTSEHNLDNRIKLIYLNLILFFSSQNTVCSIKNSKVSFSLLCSFQFCLCLKSQIPLYDCVTKYGSFLNQKRPKFKDLIIYQSLQTQEYTSLLLHRALSLKGQFLVQGDLWQNTILGLKWVFFFQ